MAKNKKEYREVVLNSKRSDYDVLADGCCSIKDLLAPASIKLNSETELMIENNYSRTYVLSGIQPQVHIGWLDPLFSPGFDVDTAIYIEPVDERMAEDNLTDQIAQKEAEYIQEKERGSVKNTTKLESEIRELYNQRMRLEGHVENMFTVEILTTLFAKDVTELNKNEQRLQAKMGKKNKLMPLYLRQAEAFQSVLPFGNNLISDYYRNFGTGAAGDCFPFYNTEFSQDDGYMFALNKETGTPIFVNPFLKTVFNNANMSVFGASGSGKTYFLSLFIMHFIVGGGIGVVVDAEGEFGKVTRALKGSYVQIQAGKNSLNPFDINVEIEVNDDGFPTGKKFVNIKEKASSILNLLAIMSGGIMDATMMSDVSNIILQLYDNFGITEDKNSLYTTEKFNKETGEYNAGYVKKRMPQMSDFHNLLYQVANGIDAKGNVVGEKDEGLLKLHKTLAMFVKGGLYDMFDCQTSDDIVLDGKHLVTFDISKLEENILRPIGSYVVFSWIWDQFVMMYPDVEKVVLLEECWMLINEMMAGSEYTGQFVEKAARRIRKRNGGLIVSSQNVREFNESKKGRAVLENTEIKMLFGQKPTNIQMTQELFNLSDGERSFLLTANQGDCLLKMKDTSTKGKVYAFPFEDKLISKAALKAKNTKEA